jgi:hypothetical protein
MITLTERIPDDKWYLVVLGDVHPGDPLFTPRAQEKFKGYVNWIKETPNARVFLNWDLFNCSTRSSKTTPFEMNEYIIKRQKKEPDFNEMDWMVELLSPIADQIIWATDGNHEYRLIDFANESKINTLCKLLSTPKRKIKYCGIGCLLFLKIGKPTPNIAKKYRDLPNRAGQTYSGYIQHTTGWGSTVGGKMNRVDKLRNIIAGCDFYCGNHNHMEGTVKTKIFLPNPLRCTLTEIRQVEVDCGWFLDYGGYVERGQMAPTDIGAPKIRFDGTKKDIHVSL